MKKVLFALACFVSSFFFASCTQEQFNDFLEKKPNISFVEEEGYISNNNSVLIGTELSFKIKASPNAGSKSPLARIVFTITDINGKIVKESRPTIQDPTVETVFTESFTTDKASTYAITATVTDEAGKVNIAELTVTYMNPVIAEIGVFKGNLAILGRVTTDGGIIPGTNPIDEPLDISDIVTRITLGSVENNKINAMIDIEGTPVIFEATQNGNDLVFDEFIFNKAINLYGVDIELNITVNMTGVLENDVLTLDGTASGTGVVKVLGINVNVNLIDGTITGELEKEE
jgi:hypothetical protein